MPASPRAALSSNQAAPFPYSHPVVLAHAARLCPCGSLPWVSPLLVFPFLPSNQLPSLLPLIFPSLFCVPGTVPGPEATVLWGQGRQSPCGHGALSLWERDTKKETGELCSILQGRVLWRNRELGDLDEEVFFWVEWGKFSFNRMAVVGLV